MNDLSEIKRRLASVKQTRQITGAMETISVAKMRKSLDMYESSREYFDALNDIYKKLPLCLDEENAGFFGEKKTGKPLLIVISADRGLCGSFNNDVFRLADGLAGENTLIMPIGKVACEHFASSEVLQPQDGLGKRSDIYAIARQATDFILNRYNKDISTLDLIYTQLITRATYAPKTVRLLPFEVDADTDEEQDVVGDFYPSPKAVLEKLVPLYLSGRIYSAIVNSRAAEDLARHTAMSAATRNADEMIDTLSAEYNRVRQSIVTRQITEMVGSTQALGKE